MKLTIDADKLAGALKRLLPITAQKSTIQVLSHVRLEVDGAAGWFSLAATELDTWGQCFMRHEGETGACTVPAKLLLDVVAGMAGQTVTLEANGGHMTVKGAAKARLPIGHVADYPLLGDVDGSAVTVPAAPIARAIGQAGYAVSRDDARMSLQGLFFGRDVVSSTDGHRAVLVHADGVLPSDAIVPEKFLPILGKVASSALEVQVAIGASTIDVIEGEWRFGARLVNGGFPDVRAVLPNGRPAGALVETAPLAAAVKLALLVKPVGMKVALTFGDDTVRVFAESQEGEVDQTVKCIGARKDAVSVNGKYLLDALGVAGDSVTISTDGALSPMLLAVEGETHIIMPMRG